jgi:nucleoside-diphosphate-sugar epimerase
MRVVVIGGTKFIGRRIVEELLARGDELLVVHRGETEPADLMPCRHLHLARADFASAAGEVRAFAPDAVIDTLAMSRTDAEAVLPHLPDAQLVVLSSVDVYEAFWLLLNDREGQPVPFNETAPLRDVRYPYTLLGQRSDDYDKLDVEPSYLDRGATVLRLAMIYGEHDPQRREEFILRRVRAGRPRIPVGAGTWLWTRAYVGDVATAVLATLGNPKAAGEAINIGEPSIRPIRGWAEQILAASGHDAELVTVADPNLPEDMWITKAYLQHLVTDGDKARDILGWRAADPIDAVARSVRWHLANPPTDANPDFSADDSALAAA